MNTKQLVVCALAGILFAGCGSSDINIQKATIPVPIKLTHTSKVVDVDLLIPAKIFMHQGKLIVFEQTPNDMFKVFDPQTFQHLYSFGNIGRANYEISASVGNSDVIPSEYVEVFDVGRIKYFEFRDSSASMVGDFVLPLKKMANPVNNMRKIDDSLYYFDHMLGDKDRNEFVKFDIELREESTFSPYPEWLPGRIPDSEKSQLYAKSSLYNKKHDQIVAFYYTFPVMKIIDAASGEVTSETHIDNLPDFSYRSEEKSRIFFAEPFLTDNYIYVMWVNMSKQEASAEKADFRPSVLVFNWEGNLMANYELDCPVITFTVSEDERKLYCTSFTGTNEILVYNLPRMRGTSETAFIENDFYSVELPSTYTLAQSSREDGINKLTESHGLRANVNYFAQQRDAENNKKYDLGVIKIEFYDPISEETTSNFFLDRDDYQLISQDEITVNNMQVGYQIIRHEDVDSQNQPIRFNILQYRFAAGQADICISIVLENEKFDECDSIMRRVVESFVLKRHQDSTVAMTYRLS